MHWTLSNKTHRYCNGVRCHIRNLILHRTPRKIIFKFNHAPILTYFLLVQRQHDTDPYNIHPKSKSIQRGVSSALQWSSILHEARHTPYFIEHHAKYIYLQIQLCTDINVLSARPKAARRQSMHSTKINADPYYVSVNVVEFTVTFRTHLILHRIASNNTFKFKHTQIPTYPLPVVVIEGGGRWCWRSQSQRDIVLNQYTDRH